MSDILSEDELRIIEEEVERVKKGKLNEVKILDMILAYAKQNRTRQYRNQLLTFISTAETNFLEGKKMALLIREKEDASVYDFRKMGTSDVFPSELTYHEGVWKFHTPPLVSVKTGEFTKAASRYIGYLVRNLIESYEVEFGGIHVMEHPAVVFEHGIERGTPFGRLFDADNRDSKKVLDALTGTFFPDDNVMFVTTMHIGVEVDEPCTNVYVMESDILPEWLKNGQR